MCFDTKNNDWNEVAKMNSFRQRGAACTVYEENVLVSCGYRLGHLDFNTVETCDNVSDALSYMPNMINGIRFHRLVAVKNKMFVCKANAILRVFDYFSESLPI